MPAGAVFFSHFTFRCGFYDNMTLTVGVQKLLTTHVNIIDMIHNPQFKMPIETFPDEEGLAVYTRETGRYFPLTMLDNRERRRFGGEGLGLLGLLLRELSKMVLNESSRSKSRSPSGVPGAAPLSKSARCRRQRARAAAKRAGKPESATGTGAAPLSKSARRRRRQRAIAAAKKAAKPVPVAGTDVAVAEISTQLANLSV